jgi:hypothetical protein
VSVAGDSDRKRLWGRAGSRCAICNVELTTLDGHDVIVGDEAHIRSKKPDGPRHDSAYPMELVDGYTNLILVCKAHHKLIDDNCEVFPADLLDKVKANHEARVGRALADKPSEWEELPDLQVITDGTEFVRLVANAQAYFPTHDHPADDADADLIADVLQSAVDWGDIAEDIGPGGQVKAAMDLQQYLDQLAERQMLVVGGMGRYRHPAGVVMRAAAFRVIRVRGNRSDVE